MTISFARQAKRIECAAASVCRALIWAAVVFTLAVACVARAQIFTSSIVSSEATMPMQHGSSIVELDDGSLLVSWYSATNEAARDSRIFYRRSTSDGSNWGPTQIAVSPGERARESWFANKAVGNSVLFQDKENVLWLFYAAVEAGGWSGAHVDYKTSRDRGHTWSESRRLTTGLGDLPRNKPVELPDARFSYRSLIPPFESMLTGRGGKHARNFCNRAIRPSMARNLAILLLLL